MQNEVSIQEFSMRTCIFNFCNWSSSVFHYSYLLDLLINVDLADLYRKTSCNIVLTKFNQDRNVVNTNITMPFRYFKIFMKHNKDGYSRFIFIIIKKLLSLH